MLVGFLHPILARRGQAADPFDSTGEGSVAARVHALPQIAERGLRLDRTLLVVDRQRPLELRPQRKRAAAADKRISRRA